MSRLDDRFASLMRTRTPDLWSAVEDRDVGPMPTAPGGRRLVAAITALVVAVGGFLVVMSAFRGDEPLVGEPEPTPSIDGAQAPTSAEIVGTFPVAETASSVVYGEGSVWVAAASDDGTPPGKIFRIDPATHEVQAEILVEVFPTWEVGGGAMVVADGSLWITGVLDRPGGVDDPGGDIDAAVIRIDTATNEVVETFQLGGDVGADLTFLHGELWVLLFGDETVEHSMEIVRLDPATGEIVARIQLSATWAHTLVSAGGRLIVVEGGRIAVNVGGHITTVDPATNAVAARSEIDSEYSPDGPVVWRDQVWAAVWGGFARFDPVTVDMIERSPHFDPSRFAVCCGFLEADDRGIWFLGFDGRTAGPGIRLDLFDPATGEVAELVPLTGDESPVAMAIAPEGVWILNVEGSLTHIEITGADRL